MGITGADDAGLLYVRMAEHHGLHLRRPDLEAGGIDHPLQAVNDEKVSVIVVVAQITGEKESFPSDLDKTIPGGLGIVPVPFKYLGTAGDDLSGLVGAQGFQRLGIHHQGLGI